MKILITGGSGMLGSAFKNIETDHDLILVGSKDCDLMNYDQTFKMFSYFMPDAVIHLAAKVGGVKGNSEYIADYFHENIMINTNVLDISRRFRIEKVVSLLSTCIYPDNPIYPLSEDQIHNGEPHYSNFGYAYAKRMLDVYSRAIRKQFGLEYITAVPNNIYGENDNFDIENGHVIPSLIRKIHNSKKTGIPPLIWGSGKPLREFTYSKDIAEILMFLLENYCGEEPINIGNTKQYTIKQIVALLSNIIDYKGEINWDDKMPEGQFKKPSSNKKFLKINSEFVYTDIGVGLNNTCEWFIKNYPNVRGIK